MSLTTGNGTSQNINYGSAAAIDNFTAYTILVWLKLNTLSTFTNVITKDSGAPTGWLIYIHNPTTRIAIDAGRATQGMSNIAATGTLSTATWYCLAFTVDHAATPVGHIYLGTLTSNMAEVSYQLQRDGSGAFNADAAGSFTVGGAASSAAGVTFDRVMYVNRALTLGECQSWQFAPRVLPNTAIYTICGRTGTATQPDYSGGGNSGTVSSATLADPAPLRGDAARRTDADYEAYVVAVAAGKPWLYYSQQRRVA